VSGRFIENRVLPPVCAAGLFGYGRGTQKVYPVAEVYATDQELADGETEGQPEAPHAWFASKHDAEAFAKLDSL